MSAHILSPKHESHPQAPQGSEPRRGRQTQKYQEVSSARDVPTGRVWGVVLAVFVLVFVTTLALAALGETTTGSGVMPGLDSLLRLVSAAYIG